MAKRRKKQAIQTPDIEEYSLFTNLLSYYEANKGKIKKHYKRISKVYLDYNEDNFLREPQFKALEIYVFLKEFFNNRKVFEIFKELYDHDNLKIATRGQKDTLFDDYYENEKEIFAAYYEELQKQLEGLERNYPDYVFALTMGTGKTILMATCIFYEFILAKKFPKDERFAHNALVFAPDKTVLESLREIITFDKSLVIPKEYQNFINTEVKFHFLADTSTQLNTIDGSDFNIVITNQQKISLQEKKKEASAAKKLLDSDVLSELDDLDEMLDLDNVVLVDDKYLTKNQRFEKLLRLNNLAIYVDEAHHTFGKAFDSIKKLKASIDAIADKTKVVGCYNFTGTPYVNNKLIPEVVYAYSLKDAIDKKFLKNPIVKAYENVGEADFVEETIKDFWEHYKGKRYENMLPKMAIFAPSIDVLENDLKPAVEAVLDELGIDTNRILVNVGDPKLTSNDDIREFVNLDTPGSEKQFILLVNKGQEGWNCRSLFATALYRKPKSTIFVLQATMRCLRSVEPVQLDGRIYLSVENEQILAKELEANFNMKLENFGNKNADDKQELTLRVKKPIEKIKLKRVKRTYELKEKKLSDKEAIDFGLENLDTSKYRSSVITMRGLEKIGDHTYKEEVQKQQQRYSSLMLVSLCAAYIGKPSLLIEELIEGSKEGMKEVLKSVNEFNEIIYDVVIPKLFEHIWELEEKQESEEFDIPLIKEPPEGQDGYKCVTATLEKVVKESEFIDRKSKSFHYAPYCFDSKPEMTFFKKAMRDDKDIKKIYFTGQLTHGQSDFYVSYIDPESHTVRKYYPDFLIEKEDGSWVIVEIKGENKLDDAVVQAKKKYAEDMAVANSFSYLFVPSKKAIDMSVRSILNMEEEQIYKRDELL